MNTELFITTPRLGTVSVDTALGDPYIEGVGTVFTATDVGKQIIIRSTSGDIRRVIATFTDATHVKLDSDILTTQTGMYFYVDYATMDLYDDFPYSLNYAIADIRTPESRNSSFSKTIKIPGSKANNITFDHVFEIDAEGSFNPNIRAFIIVYSNYIPVFNGNLQLLKINREQDKIEYEVSIFGKIGDLFQKVADKLLTDLDLSDLDQTGTASQITSTWATPTDLFYPYLDNGRQNISTATPAYISDQIAPAIKVSRIFEDILSSVGYSCLDAVTLYAETGMDKLYIPCLKEWRRKVQVDASINLAQGGGVYSAWKLKIDRIRTGVTEEVLMGTVGGVFSGNYLNIYSGQFELDWGDLVYMTRDIPIAGTSAYLANNNTFLTVTSLDNEYYYNSPIAYKVGTSQTFATIGPIGDQKVPLDVDSGGIFYDTYSLWDTAFYYGTTPNKKTQGFLPDNYKQRDFLLSLIKMFNLYLEPVFDNDTVISILPRDTYYQNLNIVDWTYKLDVGQNIELIPMGELDWKEYLFSYKPDEDFWNKDYKSKTFETYGQRNVIVENDFIATKKNITCEVAPFPLRQSAYNNLVLSNCIKDGVSTIPNTYTGVMRVIYFDGKMVTGATTLDGGAQANYPFSGHLVGNTPQVPTFDYNWASPRFLYYTMNDPTLYPYSANLYTEYWQNFIQEISDKYSKIFIAYFNLTPEDVRELDFSAKYFIDGTYFRLNKVIDFNPIGNQLTKCELIRIQEAVYGAQVVSNGNTQVGQSAESEAPYIGVTVPPGTAIVGDALGFGKPQAITQDLELDSSARATVTGFRGIALDTAIPTNGQVYVYNSGSAKWEPQTPSGGGGTPGGANKQVQYNDSGSFGAEAGFEYDKTTNELTVPDLIDSGLTASEIVGTNASKKLVSLAVATYPSLTELTYLKGATSAIQTQLNAKEATANKDASGGYVGLTLFKINFKNVLNTFISFFTNSNTAARTYTFQDRNGTIADDTDLALKAPLASPALTGSPTAPTQSANDNSTKIATTAYADAMALNKIDYWLQGVGATLNPADATNYHFGLSDATPATATTNRRFKFAVAGTLKLASLTVLQANNGSNETVTVYLRNVSTATDTSIGTFTSDFGATTSATFNYSGLSVAVNNTDYYTLKIACPTWATNPSGWALTCLLVIQ